MPMQKKRLGKAVEEASLDPNQAPAKLTAPLLDRMMRIWVMLSQVCALSLCEQSTVSLPVYLS